MEKVAVGVKLQRESGNKTSMRPLTRNQSCSTGSARHSAYSSLDGSHSGICLDPLRPMIELCEMLFKGVHATTDFISYCS